MNLDWKTLSLKKSSKVIHKIKRTWFEKKFGPICKICYNFAIITHCKWFFFRVLIGCIKFVFSNKTHIQSSLLTASLLTVSRNHGTCNVDLYKQDCNTKIYLHLSYRLVKIRKFRTNTMHNLFIRSLLKNTIKYKKLKT